MASVELERTYIEATIRTAGDLRTIATTMQLHELSQLELPEIERITQEVARVVPAGNVPGLILNGLARLDGRTVAEAESRKHVGLLFRGIKVALDKALYSTYFMGPAAVLYGYQQILRLAGKDPDSAFPEGTWQFYLQLALREDSARHTNEATGFQQRLQSENRNLSEADQLAAWMVSIASIVAQLPALLSNEWRERAFLHLLAQFAEAQSLRNTAEYHQLYRRWEQERPYARDAGQPSYAVMRRQRFDAFCQPYVAAFKRHYREQFEVQWQTLEAQALPNYQNQMTWLAYLQPEAYSEVRQHYRWDEASLGVIWQGRYYLVPLHKLLDPLVARQYAHVILAALTPQPAATLDDVLVTASREHHLTLRKLLSEDEQVDLERLRRVPVILNWDTQDAAQPLAFIRQAKRGIGDHALTIIRTQESMVFDQSHIFFDGGWGAAIAQILTNEALLWAEELNRSPQATPMSAFQLYTPPLQANAKLIAAAKKVRIRAETTAENTAVHLKPILSLRTLLQQRSDLAKITVNDLFLLYRGMHALMYKPSPAVQQQLEKLSADKRPAVVKALQAVKEALEPIHIKNPAILIPIDASRYDPRERVFPTTFWNPLTDFVQVHRDSLLALEATKSENTRQSHQQFEKKQAEYLRLVAGFGELLARYKDIALRGQSASTLSIKSLAYLPLSVQQLFANLPGRFDVMNEVIKGDEVFSNVGRVARGSSLRRFITAKDDNEKKTLCWGVITDDSGTVRLSLRDFRLHVQLLAECGYESLAQQITQDYLDSYAEGLNRYIGELREITVTSPKGTGILRGLFGL